MGLFGKSYDYKFNKESAHQNEMLEKEQSFTENMWNQTNDWNLAQWNRENEYNSPVSQMQRLAMAGINPNNAAAAIAGNANAAGSVQADAMGSPSAPSAPSPTGTDLATSVLGAGSTALDAIMTGVNAYKTLKAEIPEIQQNIDESKSRIPVNESSVGVNTSTTAVNEAEVGVKNEQARNISAQTATEDAVRREHEQRIDNLKAEKDLTEKDIAAKNQEIAESKAREKNYLQQAKLAVTQQDKERAMTAYYNQLKKTEELNTQKAELEKKNQEIKNKEDKENNEYREKQRRNNIDPDEHNDKTQTMKKTAMDKADAEDKEFNNNLAKSRLHWVWDNKEHTLGHAEDISGRIIPVDENGVPIRKSGSSNSPRGKGNVRRFTSNNHVNPVPHLRR